MRRALVRGRMRYDIAVSELVRQALEVNQAFLALGNELFEADGATSSPNSPRLSEN